MLESHRYFAPTTPIDLVIIRTFRVVSEISYETRTIRKWSSNFYEYV